VLRLLAGIQPPWTLTGGGALAGIHTRHRTTRDLDLFWQGRRELGSAPTEVANRLTAAGLEVSTLEKSGSFWRLQVRDAGESVLVDLVADPVPLAETPMATLFEGVTIQVDTVHQILVNKLCALLSRSELRDLGDVQVLLALGGDLARGLADAGKQDAGFSPLTFAWVLKNLPVRSLARALKMLEPAIDALERFRDTLAETVASAAIPG